MIDEATRLIVRNLIAITAPDLSRQRHHDDATAILGRDMRQFFAGWLSTYGEVFLDRRFSSVRNSRV
jgi:hypothetical protein